MREISHIVLHCSDSDFGDAAIIDDWHRKRGFNSIGYHFVILNGSRRSCIYRLEDDGTVELGREISLKGAHCKGYNSKTIGICMIGIAAFTPLQWQGLKRLCTDLKDKYGVQRIVGHYELDENKTCPCVNMDSVRKWLGESWTI